MAERPVIHALVDMRAKLNGDMIKLQRQIQDVRNQIHHIDETLRTFGYKPDPNSIKPRLSNARTFRKNELSNLIRDILRNSNKPLTSRQIAVIVMRNRGMDIDDEDLMKRMKDGVRYAKRKILQRQAELFE